MKAVGEVEKGRERVQTRKSSAGVGAKVRQVPPGRYSRYGGGGEFSLESVSLSKSPDLALSLCLCMSVLL